MLGLFAKTFFLLQNKRTLCNKFSQRIFAFLLVRKVMNHALYCLSFEAERDESRPYGWRMATDLYFTNAFIFVFRNGMA